MIQTEELSPSAIWAARCRETFISWIHLVWSITLRALCFHIFWHTRAGNCAHKGQTENKHTERSVWTVRRWNLIKHTRRQIGEAHTPSSLQRLRSSFLIPPSPTSSSSGTIQQEFVFWDAHKLHRTELFLHFNGLKHKLSFCLFAPLLFLPCRAETICRAWIKINFSPWWKDAASRLLAACGTADKSCLPRGAVRATQRCTMSCSFCLLFHHCSPTASAKHRETQRWVTLLSSEWQSREKRQQEVNSAWLPAGFLSEVTLF